MKASDYIARSLEHHGVSQVFEMVGGMIIHIIDSLAQRGRIRIVSMHHEQAAAFAADGAGRMTGIPGVALATSGPGATNLLTGIGSCYFDSTPAVFITGQVNRGELKGDRPIRQLGFQETDIVSMARPITKSARMVRDPAELPAILDEAFSLAVAGRPGPVLVDIPMDVQRAEIDPPAPPTPRAEHRPPDHTLVSEALRALSKASSPLILVGGGIRSARVTDLLRRFIGLVRIPTVNSLMGVDVLPGTDAMRVGMIGSYGNRWANLALSRCDALLVLGSRLDIRQTGADTKAFKGGRAIFHVDCDPGEINNRIPGCTSIVSGLAAFLETAMPLAAAAPSHRPWIEEIAELRARWPDTGELPKIQGINPNAFMHQLSRASAKSAAFVVDVGQHQMWAAQSLSLTATQRFLTSGGMGSMGFALPAAIGAAISASPAPVVVVAGDGGFQCNIHELQTVVRNRLPLKMVVLNNRCHGMVRQFQESYFESRYPSTLNGYDAPDFAKVAVAFGVDARSISGATEIEPALRWLWSDPSSPALLEVGIDTMANAYPKLAFGKPISEMEPHAKPLDMEST